MKSRYRTLKEINFVSVQHWTEKSVKEGPPPHRELKFSVFTNYR